MREQYFVSPSNVVITFADVQIGHLQNLAISEKYNLQPIKNLWSSNVVTFVPGISEFSATATKAYIEYNTLLGSAQDILKTINTLNNLNNTWGDISGVDVGEKLMSTLSSGITTAVDWAFGRDPNNSVPVQVPPQISDIFIRIINGVASLGEVFSNLAFDIRVKNPVVSGQIFPTGSIQNMPDLWVLRGCQLESRAINISVGNVVILEEVVIRAKNNYDTGISNAANGYVPFT